MKTAIKGAIKGALTGVIQGAIKGALTGALQGAFSSRFLEAAPRCLVWRARPQSGPEKPGRSARKLPAKSAPKCAR